MAAGAIVVLAALGCTGTIDDPGARSVAGQRPPTGPGAGAGPGALPGMPQPPGSPGTIPPGATPPGGSRDAGPGGILPPGGPSPIRRLTRAEYRSTIEALLGVDAASAIQDDDLPEDPDAFGFDNNAYAQGPVPKQGAKAYRDAGEAVAARAASALATLLPCDPARAGEDACAAQFIASFGKRAFRRPLDTADIDRWKAMYQAAKTASSFARAVEVVVRAFLQSPNFIYRVEFGVAPAVDGRLKLSAHEIASRLSYFLWGTMPDGELFRAADAGELPARAAVERQARRMIEDVPKAESAVLRFHRMWLDLQDRLRRDDTLAKDPKAFPGFAADLPKLFRQESEWLVMTTVFGGGTMGDLLLAPHTHVNARLAQFYGMSGISGDGFRKVPLDASRRLGLLTQASFLARQAKADRTSPVHRGKFIRNKILCQEIPPPPPDASMILPVGGATVRERVERHMQGTCAACHRLMDPVGLGFEQFDGIGRWADGVDSSGEMVATLDANGKFTGAIELARRLAASAEVRACVVRQWFRYAFGRTETPEDGTTIKGLEAALAGAGSSLRELMFAVATSDAFLYRTVAAP